jgi:hypothetical protein
MEVKGITMQTRSLGPSFSAMFHLTSAQWEHARKIQTQLELAKRDLALSYVDALINSPDIRVLLAKHGAGDPFTAEEKHFLDGHPEITAALSRASAIYPSIAKALETLPRHPIDTTHAILKREAQDSQLSDFVQNVLRPHYTAAVFQALLKASNHCKERVDLDLEKGTISVPDEFPTRPATSLVSFLKHLFRPRRFG